MVVDNIEHHAESQRVSAIDESAKVVRRSV